MTATILGSGTCVPVPSRGAAGYLFRAGAAAFLVDAGPGTLKALAAQGQDIMDLELVLLSHLHPDHTLDLATLLQAANSTPGTRRSRPLLLAGCQGLSTFVSKLWGLYDGLEPDGYTLEIRELVPGATRFSQEWTLTAGLSGHTPESLCYRFEHQGRSIVYSGDATRNGDLVTVARGADLLICECSLPDGWKTPDHLTAGQAGAIARDAMVGALVLTHLYPPALEADVVAQARSAYDGPVVLASDGWTATV